MGCQACSSENMSSESKLNRDYAQQVMQSEPLNTSSWYIMIKADVLGRCCTPNWLVKQVITLPRGLQGLIMIAPKVS